MSESSSADIVWLSRRKQPPGFTPRDVTDLARWSSEERRVGMCHGEMGSFALLYDDERPWSSWGIVRQGSTVLLWNCVTLADVGRFGSIAAALAAVSSEIAAELEQATPASVIPFATANARLRPNLVA